MRRRSIVRFFTFGTVALALAACGGGGGGGGAPSGGGSTQGVLAVARANGANGFVRAVEAAGLTETLSGPGPFTIFAPSDRAIGGRPRFQSREQAQALIAYHVVPGTFTTDFLAGVDVNYTTLTGRAVNVDGVGGLRVNGVNVVRADLTAENGVVHIIDGVLTPK